MTIDDADTSILDHELIAIDHHGALCSCGGRTGNWLEHLAAIALTTLDAPTDGSARRYKTTYAFPHALQLHIRALAARLDVPSVRLVLQAENRHQASLRRYLDELGLTGFVIRHDRMQQLRRLRSISRARRRVEQHGSQESIAS